jgi:CHAT domain-containing protein
MRNGDRWKAKVLGEAQRFIRNLSLDDVREILREQGVEPTDVEWQSKALVHAAGHDISRLRGNERLIEHPYYWAALFLIGDRF